MYFYQSLLSNGIQQLDTVADHWSTTRTAEVTAAHSGKKPFILQPPSQKSELQAVIQRPKPSQSSGDMSPMANNITSVFI